MQLTPDEQTKLLADTIEYINSATTPEERQRRKQEMYMILYSNQMTLKEYLESKTRGSGGLDKTPPV